MNGVPNTLGAPVMQLWAPCKGLGVKPRSSSYLDVFKIISKDTIKNCQLVDKFYLKNWLTHSNKKITKKNFLCTNYVYVF